MKAKQSIMTSEQQAAVNEMARQLYKIRMANKAKTEELARFAAVVDSNESAFRNGVPFEFALTSAEGSRKVSGRLRFRTQRVWEDVDMVFEKL